MAGLIASLLSIWAVVLPLKLPRDVYEFSGRMFQMPVNYIQRDKLSKIRVFVSEDCGKTWKHEKDFKPDVEMMAFTVPDDGLYWFAAQVVLKDGSCVPSDLADLVPSQKVFINTTGRPLGNQKTYAELQRENQDLRKQVEQLQNKLSESESGRKPK